MLEIIKWYGRTGNNIIQLLNCLFVSEYLKEDLCYPNHFLFEKKERKDKTVKHIFFNRDDIVKSFKLDKNIFGLNKEIVICKLRRIIKVKDIDISNSLIIHIRGGDVFKEPIPKQYPQPPLSFFKNVIEKDENKNILLISQDILNPVIDKLLDNDLNFKLRSLEEDINIIINGEYVCFGNTCFVPSLLLLNTKLKKVYYPEYCHSYLVDLLDCEKEMIPLPNYIKKGEWKNTDEQRRFMIEYEYN